MVRKIFGKTFYAAIFLLSFALLTYLIGTMTKDFLHDYAVFQTEDHHAIVTEKFSKKSLIGMPTYFVTVDLNVTNSYDRVGNRVFAWQFKQLNVRDELNGHYVKGEHFLTTLDIILDSFIFLFIMLFLIVCLVVLLMWPVFKYLDKKEDVQHSKPKKKSFTRLRKITPGKWHHHLDNLSLMSILFTVFIIVCCIFASSFLVNGIHKLAPIGKTKTFAIVTDKNSESEINYYIGEVSDPYYSLTLEFDDHHGNPVKVIKEVTRSTFKKHRNGSTVDVSYVNWNPYNVFVRDYHWFNLLEIFIYVKFDFNMIILTALLIFAIAGYRKWAKKRKKTESGG